MSEVSQVSEGSLTASDTNESCEKSSQNYKNSPGSVDAMNIEPRKLMMMIKKVKQGINVDENITLKKQQLKGMIIRAKRAGARGYDIILSLSRDLSVDVDDVVSALEKTRLIGMTEWIKRRT